MLKCGGGCDRSEDKGVNIEVKSDKDALIYFYKRIENEDIKTIVFDKNQKI